MLRKALILCILPLFLGACGEEENDTPDVVAPTNLTVQLTQDENNPARVEVVATAVNANYYDFDFGDGTQATPTVSNNGRAAYTYSQSGNYTIRVRAFATNNIFVAEEQPVEISIAQSGDFPTTGYTTPESYSGYELVWRDEFDGNQLNTANWSYEIGTGNNGWGNNELQYYRQENTSVADGMLTITAKREEFGGRSYTSSRLITMGKQSFQYGRIDIRAAMPFGQGIWPALWMLGDNFPTAGWPFCGEIDIMEMIGGSPINERTVHGTIHWDNNGSYANAGDSYTLSSGRLADNFHVYSIEWDASTIRWYIDDILYNTIDTTPAALSEFRAPHFFIFNIAVGGNWPGSPNDATTFPQRMHVDYIRVFQAQ